MNFAPNAERLTPNSYFFMNVTPNAERITPNLHFENLMTSPTLIPFAANQPLFISRA